MKENTCWKEKLLVETSTPWSIQSIYTRTLERATFVLQVERRVFLNQRHSPSSDFTANIRNSTRLHENSQITVIYLV